MKILDFREHPEVKSAITDLYISAFPEEERPPVSLFYKSLEKSKGNTLLAFYDNDEFIGFTYTKKYKDICYLFFLAVSENKRNQGYGSRILEYIKEAEKPNTILLSYEEIDEKYPDNDLRKKRKSFYERHEFIYNGFKTVEYGVTYESAYYGSHPVSYQDFKKIFVQGFSKTVILFLRKKN